MVRPMSAPGSAISLSWAGRRKLHYWITVSNAEKGILMDSTVTSSGLEDVVAAAETVLVDAQVGLETLRVEVANLTRLHHSRLGPLYAQLDEYDALIAETVAALSGDPDDIRKAYEARAKISVMPDIDEPAAAAEPSDAAPDDQRSPGAAGEHVPRQGDRGDGESLGRPSRMAQRLYRELARRAHPDLTQDPADKERRSAFIAKVNDAYRQGDVGTLQRLGEEWTVATAQVPEPGSPAREQWLRGRLIWLRARIAKIEVERGTLLADPMGELLAKYEFNPSRALDELGEVLSEQLIERQAKLAELLGG
jgi:hypothetical protein